MKHLKSTENKKPKLKFLVGMLLLIGALLITTKLVQKSQDTRSSAASNACTNGTKKCSSGTIYSCKNNRWVASKKCSSGCKNSTQCNTTSTCTSFTYSSWGSCTNGKQTRTVKSKSPSGCTGGNPVISRSCTSTSSGGGGSAPVTCTVNDKKCFTEGKYEYAGTCKAGSSANYWSKVRCVHGCSNGQCI